LLNTCSQLLPFGYSEVSAILLWFSSFPLFWFMSLLFQVIFKK
jgi:hypothetical protein